MLIGYRDRALNLHRLVYLPSADTECKAVREACLLHQYRSNTRKGRSDELPQVMSSKFQLRTTSLKAVPDGGH